MKKIFLSYMVLIFGVCTFVIPVNGFDLLTPYTFVEVCSLSFLTNVFEPESCPDLSVKIYPGNGEWNVLHASSSTYLHSALGYDFVGVNTTGKTSEKNMCVCLRMDMGLKKSAQLDFLMTIPASADHQYSLFISKDKNIPLNITSCGDGTLTFVSFLNKEKKLQRNVIRIDMKTNTAECSFAPGKIFPVEWNEDGFWIKELPEETGAFHFIMPFGFYRGCDGGITSVRRKIGTRSLVFPLYETFYLDSKSKLKPDSTVETERLIQQLVR